MANSCRKSPSHKVIQEKATPRFAGKIQDTF